MNAPVQVEIRGLLPTPTGCGVFLTNSIKTIAIFVDHSVATAISMTLQKVKKARPLTHDLIGSIFAGLGAKVLKVLVNDLKDDTFFARLFIAQENELGKTMIEIDSRPSDAIAIALQQGCPIFVAREVWDKAEEMAWALDQAAASENPPADGGAEKP